MPDDPAKAPPARAPLTGIRVLDLSRLLPGPYCTLILADLGADVIKVEDTGAGDYLRDLPPQKRGMGGAFYALNRGKRSVAIDLKREEGQQLLLAMAAQAEVLVESFRPGVMDRLGLSASLLRSKNPQLTICRISGYGQDGPLAQRAGHDINYLALAGVLGAGGAKDGPPALSGVQLADVAGGALWAAIRILASLFGDRGADLDVSMTEGAMSLLLPWLGDMAFGGDPLRRGEGMLNGGLASYGCYQSNDGKYLAAGSLEAKFAERLGETLGVTTDPNDMLAGPERQRELAPQLSAAFAKRTREEWERAFADADACVEPVLEAEELAQHPLHREREAFFQLPDPERGDVSLPGLPLGASRALRPAPRLGEHSRELLLAAGVSAKRFDELLASGVIRQS